MTYSMLLRYAREKDSCFPGQKTLADQSGMGERSINRHVQELEEKGFISINRRGLGKPNVYSLHVRVTKKNVKVTKKQMADQGMPYWRCMNCQFGGSF